MKFHMWGGDQLRRPQVILRVIMVYDYRDRRARKVYEGPFSPCFLLRIKNVPLFSVQNWGLGWRAEIVSPCGFLSWNHR